MRLTAAWLLWERCSVSIFAILIKTYFDEVLSLNSLKDMESYIIKNNTTVNDDDYNDLSAYLGEVLRLTYGGKWICNLDKINNSLFYGFPVIEGHSDSGVLFSPFHIVKAFILRKKTNLFYEAIENQVNPQKIDWSQFPTED